MNNIFFELSTLKKKKEEEEEEKKNPKNKISKFYIPIILLLQ